MNGRMLLGWYSPFKQSLFIFHMTYKIIQSNPKQRKFGQSRIFLAYVRFHLCAVLLVLDMIDSLPAYDSVLL